ncbi:MAG: type II toxin-antitoxin system RelE/ParE family toxin [Ruminococcus sp.]|uniref:type II toxin-antitoxin system RelE/ParE family toxin n=1 Tax=Ruminococcus sp. TaxID=41978 RepID=UPI00399A9744
MSFCVEYYESENGTCPVEEFILKQDNKMQAKIFKNLELLEIRGNELREPFSKHIEDGIFEIRNKVGNDITRIFYFFVIGQKIILTNGFIKKTQKTPKAEIALAKKYRNDYLNREEI